MSGSARAWHKLTGVTHRAAGPVWVAIAAILVAAAIALLPLTWALLLVVAGAVAVVTLVEPRLGLLLIVPAVPFGSLRQVTVGGMNVGAAEALLALVAAAWLVRRVARREVRWRWPALSLPLGLFVAALLLSALGATSLRASLKEVVKWIEVLVLYVIVADELNARWARLLVAAALATGAVAALHGIYQFLFQVGPEPFILFGRFMRAYGTFAQPNPYAGYLGLTLPIALGLLAAGVLSYKTVSLRGRGRFAPEAISTRQVSLRGRGRFAPEAISDADQSRGLLHFGRSAFARNDNADSACNDNAASARNHNVVGARWLLLAAGPGVLMLVALVMSWSRGGWLGFAAAAAMMAVAAVARSGRAAIMVTLLVALVLYGVLAGGLAQVPPAVVQRFDDFLPYVTLTDVRGREITDANFAVLERMAHWQAAIGMWADRPWLGVGAGNYEVVYDRYALPLWPLPLGHAHNYYLNVGAEAGAVGFLAYLLLWTAALWHAWRAAGRLRGWEWGVALGVLGILVHLGVHNFFDNLFVHGIYLHLAILLGVLSFFSWRSEELGANYHGT